MKVLFSIILLLSILITIPVYSAEKMRTAIIDLQARGISKVTSGAITDLIRSDLVDSGQFIVVERNQMNEILKEQGFQQTGCTDSSCAVKIGKLLSAEKILLGEVSKIGKTILITIRIVDVEKGVAEFSSREKAASEDVIDVAVRKLSIKLIERITGRRASDLALEPEKSITGYYVRSIVPGWGQFYAGSTAKGFFYSGSFLLAGGFTLFSILYYNKKDKEYDELEYGTSESTFDEKEKAAKAWGYITLASVCTVSLVYIIHWLDVLFWTEPDFKSAGIFSPDNSIYLSFAMSPGNINYLSGNGSINLKITMRF